MRRGNIIDRDNEEAEKKRPICEKYFPDNEQNLWRQSGNKKGKMTAFQMDCVAKIALAVVPSARFLLVQRARSTGFLRKKRGWNANIPGTQRYNSIGHAVACLDCDDLLLDLIIDHPTSSIRTR